MLPLLSEAVLEAVLPKAVLPEAVLPEAVLPESDGISRTRWDQFNHLQNFPDGSAFCVLRAEESIDVELADEAFSAPPFFAIYQLPPAQQPSVLAAQVRGSQP